MGKEGIPVERVQKDLQDGDIATMYFLSGEENLLVRETISSIIDSAFDSPEFREFNLDVLFGSETTVPEVLDRVSSYPVGSERRVVVVRDFEKLFPKQKARGQEEAKDEGGHLHQKAKSFLQYVRSPSPTTILVMASPKCDFRIQPFKELKAAATVVDCQTPRSRDIPSWIVGRMRLYKKQIDPDAAHLLASYTNPALGEIDRELEKLSIFIGDRGVVLPNDVREAVGASREVDAFELQKALAGRQTRRAVEVLSRLMDAGEPPGIVLATLYRFMSVLWKLHWQSARVRDRMELASLAGVPHYFLDEYLAALRVYTASDVEEAMEALLEADRLLKSSGGDQRDIMFVLIARLAKGEERADS